MLIKYRYKGFTLIELIVVMTLIILVLGIVGVNFSIRLPKEKLKSAVRDIVSSMRYARGLSQVKTKEVVVKIDLVKKQIIIDRKKRKLPKELEIVVIDPNNGEIKDGIYKIIFFPGYGCSGAEIIVKNSNNAYMIQLSPFTGKVSVKSL